MIVCTGSLHKETNCMGTWHVPHAPAHVHSTLCSQIVIELDCGFEPFGAHWYPAAHFQRAPLTYGENPQTCYPGCSSCLARRAQPPTRFRRPRLSIQTGPNWPFFHPSFHRRLQADGSEALALMPLCPLVPQRRLRQHTHAPQSKWTHEGLHQR